MPYRRLALTCLAVFLFASAAHAQREWLPCVLRTPGGSSIFLPESSAPTQLGTAVGGVNSDRFELRLGLAAADFDTFEGSDISTIRVRGTSLGFGARIADRYSLGVVLPYYDVTSVTGSASGFGDMSVELGWRSQGIEMKKRVRWWEVMGGATLPTGDEDESLGYGDPTARIGTSFQFGRLHDSQNGRRRTWARPHHLVRIGAKYGHHFGNSDLSTLATALSLVGSAGSFIYSAGIGTEWELSDGASMGPFVRDDMHQTDFSFTVGYSRLDAQFQVLLGCRVALDDDGLRDELIPTLSVVGRF